MGPALLPPPPLIFFDQTEAEGPKKNFQETGPPPPHLSRGLDDRPAPFSPSYLKVWIRHC